MCVCVFFFEKIVRVCVVCALFFFFPIMCARFIDTQIGQEAREPRGSLERPVVVGPKRGLFCPETNFGPRLVAHRLQGNQILGDTLQKEKTWVMMMKIIKILS